MESILLPFHFLILGFTAWNIIKADHMGLRWVQGRLPTLKPEEVATYHYRVWAGLVLMIVTGILMFWPLRELLLTRVQFYIKMGFVMTLILNSFAIGYLQKIAITSRFDSLTFKQKAPLFLSGAISTACWVFTAATAFFILPN
jgi:hypothetical protein